MGKRSFNYSTAPPKVQQRMRANVKVRHAQNPRWCPLVSLVPRTRPNDEKSDVMIMPLLIIAAGSSASSICPNGNARRGTRAAMRVMLSLLLVNILSAKDAPKQSAIITVTVRVRQIKCKRHKLFRIESLPLSQSGLVRLPRSEANTSYPVELCGAFLNFFPCLIEPCDKRILAINNFLVWTVRPSVKRPIKV